MQNRESCTYKEGALPPSAPLGVATIPMQKAAAPAYDSAVALVRGTLFPGLDLPFMNYAAIGTLPNTPLTELMALDFVTQELALYLDTHPGDCKAFETWKAFSGLAAESKRRYAELHGPVTREDTACFDAWDWPEDPWPWDGKTAKGGDC